MKPYSSLPSSQEPATCSCLHAAIIFLEELFFKYMDGARILSDQYRLSLRANMPARVRAECWVGTFYAIKEPTESAKR